jgi:AcrR family transcriptional regulator
MTVRAAGPSAQTRQQRAHDRVRREILRAAAEVFARRGYADATLSHLAEAAGYAPPSLYRYFKSKEEIFSSLVDELKGELHATFEAAVERGQPLQSRLEALIGAQFELLSERREFFMLLTSLPPGGTDRASLSRLRAGMTLYEADMAGWLRRHATRRELRCPIGLAARALTGIAHAFHNGHLDGTDRPPVTEQARLVVDLALRGFQAATTS